MKKSLPNSLGRIKSFLLILVLSGLGFSVYAQNPLQVQLVSSDSSCQDNGSATISVSGGVGPYTAYWLQYNQTPAGGGRDTVAIGLSADSLSPGYYFLQVYDSSTPTRLNTYFTVIIAGKFTITQTIRPATCSNSDGAIKINISSTQGPFDYEWSNGINHLGSTARLDSIVNIPSGIYSVKVTDASGCYVRGGAGTSGTVSNEGFFVYSNSPITGTATATPSNCFSGTATVTAANGTAPYSYVWNTVPAQFGNVATGLSPGYINCTVTDAVGCTRIVYVNIPAGPGYLQATSIITPSQCGASTGAVNLSVTGGAAPYTYLWSNGSTTQDLTGLAPGSYNVAITDNAGCVLRAYKYIQNVSPLNVSISGNEPGCGVATGSLNTNVSGGTAPYTYLWNTGATTQNLSSLTIGYFNVRVTDSNGCTGYDNYWLDEPVSCDVRIRGHVYNDFNGNCIQDNGEGGVANVIIRTVSGNYYASTDNNGNYEIQADAGNYTINAFTPPFWNQICPSAPTSISVNAATPGNIYNGNNFYFQPDSIFNDIQVYLSSGPARPGFPITWYLNVRNVGTTALSPTLIFHHDAQSTYSSSSPNGAYSIAQKTVTWNVPLLAPQTNRSFYVYGTMGLTSALGDSVRADAAANISGIDVNLSNNTDFYARLITGSYDPNDKLVEPRGTGEQGFITSDDSTFHYTIRFQNSGTDTAFTVVVRDTLDPSLDVTTFKLDAVSHPMTYEISGTGIVTFRFDNILLPDSFVNEPASHGLISYFINRKQDLAMGTRIENTAGIYFDFNLPIITNTTVNTLFDATVGIKEQQALLFSVSPNPSSDRSQVSFALASSQSVRLLVQDLSGRVLHIQNFGVLSSGEHQLILDRGKLGLSSGVYFIRIESEGKSSSQKWMITK
jgi:uncharacterized repeat protein (TIGR01451 family)